MSRKLFLGALTAGLLASGAAFAAPINNVGGVGVPLGNDTITQNDFETLITSPGSNFMGVGQVTSIFGGTPFSTGYTYGQNGVYLLDEFSGFTVRAIDNADASGNPIDPTKPITISLTGGELNYYTFSSDILPTLMSQSTAQAAVNLVKSGSLWLSLTPVAEDANNDTVIITIPTSANLFSVGKSNASADLDVNLALNGAATGFFNTCTIADSNAPGPVAGAHDCLAGFASLSFTGGGQNNAQGPFQVGGTDNLIAVSVPEPLSMSLFGGGLIGAAALRRRKAKKA